MIDADILDAARQRTLGLEAERICLHRLTEIDRRSDPKDEALHTLLHELRDKERTHLHEIEALDGPPGATSGPALLDEMFPSVTERLGTSPLTRDAALYYVERIKEEAYRFFRQMADLAGDDIARGLFRRLALGKLGEVARLRSILL